MPRTTENFNLVYASEGEILTSLVEENRYLIIDRQLLGIFEVFGNGVVDGWNITAGSGLSIVISPGRAVINLKYVETTTAVSLVNLEPNSTLYVLAQKALTIHNDVSVIFSTALSDSIDDATIIIGRVVTGSSSITSIDTGPRNNISFVQAALDLVKNHRHFGGENSSQIDLSKEVRGLLPSENIGDLDASKITSGRLNQSVLPQLSHYDLEDVGTLTHAQIDSLIRMLTYENSHLLGEVASVNLIQLFLSHKHIWSNIDDYAPNLLLFIPGITPDSYTDWDATTASVDKTEHVIKGIESSIGSILNKTYSSTNDFNSYFNATNIVIDKGKIKLAQSPAETLVIIDFESSAQNDEEVPGFEKKIEVASDSGGFRSTTDDKETGSFAGRITASQVVYLSYTKTYETAQDWSDYDTLSVSVKSTDLKHAQINMYLVYLDADSKEVTESPIVLLSQNEVTDGFKQKTIDLSSYHADTIKKIIIYTDTSLGWDVSANFTIFFDNITLKKSSLYYEEGQIFYRLNTPIPAQWEAISYDYVLNGGLIKVRARSASTPTALGLTPFSGYLAASGDSPNVENNTNLEINIIMTANSDKTATPELDTLKVVYVIPSSDNGFVIDTFDDWDNGTYSQKTDITTTPGSVRIKEDINVGNIFYGNSVLMSEIDILDMPVLGSTGNLVPPAPNQIATFTTADTAVSGSLETNYDLVYGVNRLEGGNYLLCDAGNDRIIEIDAEGNFIFGLGTYVGNSDELTVLSTVYRISNGYLTLVLSKKVDVTTVDLSKIEIVTETETIVLGGSDTVVQDVLVASDKTACVFNILLSSDNQELVYDKTSMKLILREGVFEEELSELLKVSESLRIGGLDIFKGEFIYVNDIHAPIHVTILENGNYLISNAKRWGRENSGIASVVEISPTGTNVFSYDQDNFSFSLETGGCAIEYDEDFFAFSGITGEASIIKADDVEVDEVRVHAGDSSVDEFTINVGTVFQLAADAYDSEDKQMFGDRVFWSSNNLSVVSVSKNGILSANTKGKATITAEINGVTGTASVEVVEENSFPSVSTVEFTGTEKDIATLATGKTILIDRVSKKTRYEYVSSDGLFPSSVDLESSTGLLVIAEKSLVKDKSSRIIKVDDRGNVLFDFGFGQVDSPNSVRSLIDNSVIISS